MPIAPNQLIRSAEVLALAATKADLDSVTGKLVLAQLPGTIVADIAVAQATADAAATAASSADASADQAASDAAAALAAASAAQTTANAAIPETARGVANGVATLGPDGKLTPAQAPAGGGGGGGGSTLTPPTTSTFTTFVNAGASTYINHATALIVRPEPVNQLQNYVRGFFVAPPAGPYQAIMRIDRDDIDQPWHQFGPAWRNSASGKIDNTAHGPSTGANGEVFINIGRLLWDNALTVAGGGPNWPLFERGLWWKITDNRTDNRNVYFSRVPADRIPDYNEWVLFSIVLRDNYIDPDQVGIAGNCIEKGNSFPNLPLQYRVSHWQVETLVP